MSSDDTFDSTIADNYTFGNSTSSTGIEINKYIEVTHGKIRCRVKYSTLLHSIKFPVILNGSVRMPLLLDLLDNPNDIDFISAHLINLPDTGITKNWKGMMDLSTWQKLDEKIIEIHGNLKFTLRKMKAADFLSIEYIEVECKNAMVFFNL